MKNAKRRSAQSWSFALLAVALALLGAQAQPLAPSVQNVPQAPQTTAPTDLSPPVTEVIKLAESGVGDDVVLAYIQNSQSIFNLSADDILYLRDVGLSSPVTTAMLNHDIALRNQAPQSVAAPPVPTTPPPAVPTTTPEAASAPTYVTEPPAEVSYFYNDLSPYGAWVDLEGFGWCWQPSVVVIQRSWRPYCDGGRWIYTDAGWCWHSDYSWGWAPFHYGRWYLHSRCGWVWTPDTVWAPAWVTWRVGGTSCGWAPLPPHAYFDAGLGWRFNGERVGLDFDFGLHADHFTFVANSDFNARDLGRHRLAPTEVKTVYNQTTIINNYAVNNKTIVNRGIPVEKVAAATHTEIRKAPIRDLPAGPGRAPRAPVADRGTPVIYRPQLTALTKPAPVIVQKVDARHPVIQHEPITPVRTERPSAPVGRAAAPSFAPPGQKAPSYPQSYSSPKVNQPSAGTPSYTPVPRYPETSKPTHSTPAYQPSPTAPSAPAPTRSSENKPVQRSTPAYQPMPPASASPASSSRSERSVPPGNTEAGAAHYSSGVHAQPSPGPAAQPSTPHAYSPKVAQQHDEGRSRPQSEQHQAAPSPSRSENNPSSSSHSDKAPGSSSKNQAP